MIKYLINKLKIKKEILQDIKEPEKPKFEILLSKQSNYYKMEINNDITIVNM